MSRMGKAAAIVSVSILLSRILGFGRDIVMANILGAGTETDVYFAAFFVPDVLFYLMAGGYLTITFIPILSRHFANNDEAAGWTSFAAIVKPLTGFMVAVTVVAMLAADRLVELAYVDFPGLLGTPGATFSSADLGRVADLMRIVLPAQVFFMLGSLLMAVQYARQQFLIPSLAPLVYNLGIIAGGLTWSAVVDLEATGFAWGALVGAAIGNFGLQVWGARRVGLIWVPKASWRNPDVREYVALSIPLMLGQSIAVLDEQFVRVFGNLLGEGAISTLNYARRLNMVPVGVIAQAAGVAAYPFLARMASEGKDRQLSETLTTAVRYAVFVSGAATAALIAVSQPAVRVALQHGSFDVDSTIATAAALAVFAITIPLWGAHQVYARGFYARRQMWPPVLIGTAWTALGIPIYLTLIQRMGQQGLPTASAITVGGYAISLAALWYKRVGYEHLGELARTVARSVAAGLPAGLATWWVVNAVGGPLESMSLTRGIIALVVGAVVLLATYGGASFVLGSTEMTDLAQRRS